ncbi:hypothetical protein GCM10011348_29730 [Marinobacterium nitratireducens]|uniref:Uncharacterized protein n=1 Tax=Marinobacterium nitratireducens TaxID=518897 RepID=A0A917ZKZ8_9GAMM|nr:hypothetical protein GCM10011348_29730 [Marinobacterium nitratireducens]
MDTDTVGGQSLNRFADIHGIATESVQLGHDKHITGLQPVKQPDKLRTLTGRDATADAFGHDAALTD